MKIRDLQQAYFQKAQKVNDIEKEPIPVDLYKVAEYTTRCINEMQDAVMEYEIPIEIEEIENVLDEIINKYFGDHPIGYADNA